jgi:hypothetical protein
LRRQGRRAVSVLGRVACRPSDLPTCDESAYGTRDGHEAAAIGCRMLPRPVMPFARYGERSDLVFLCRDKVATRQVRAGRYPPSPCSAVRHSASTIVGGTGTTREKRELPHREATRAAAFTGANKRKHGSLGAQYHKDGVGYSVRGASPRRREARVAMIEAASTCKRDPCL